MNRSLDNACNCTYSGGRSYMKALAPRLWEPLDTKQDVRSMPRTGEQSLYEGSRCRNQSVKIVFLEFARKNMDGTNPEGTVDLVLG
jgi:hypothetical protein